MNWTDILREHITELIAIITGIMGGSYLERRRKKAEIKAADADATQKIVDLYQETIDDLEQRYKRRYKEMETFYAERLEKMKEQIRVELREEVKAEVAKEVEKEVERKFQKRIEELLAEIEQLKAEIKSLRTNLELWKTKYRKLKEAFDEYRKKHGDQ